MEVFARRIGGGEGPKWQRAGNQCQEERHGAAQRYLAERSHLEKEQDGGTGFGYVSVDGKKFGSGGGC